MTALETAADKLSALTWRVLSRDRSIERDDPTLVRHVHDLAALEQVIGDEGDFRTLLHETMREDEGRGDRERLAALSHEERLIQLLATLEQDPVYLDEYERFVGGMAFAGDADIPTFETGLEAIRRLSTL